MERRQEIALIVALYFVGFVAVQNWVLDPQLTALKAAQQYEGAIDSYKDKSENVNSRLRAKRLWLDKLVVKRELLSDMIFTAAKAEEFLSDLDVFCQQSECEIARLRYVGETEQSVPSIVTRTTALTVYGDYNNIIKLIQKLTSRSQKVSIESLGMTTIPANPQHVLCRLVITIYVNLDAEGRADAEAQLSH
jgi:hypothetical protein